MPESFSVPAATPRFALPMLFAGQAQKEFFVNEALTLIDGALTGAVLASAATPPGTAAEGARYRVLSGASGAWSGRADQIAMRIAGGWKFVAPFAGMKLYDQATGHCLVFRDGWKKAEVTAIPAGGTVIDVEARNAISQLVSALRLIGIIIP